MTSRWFAAALVIGTAKVTDGPLDWYLSKAAPGRDLSSGQFRRAPATVPEI